MTDSVADDVSGAVIKPAGWKKRHKFHYAWRAWCAVVDFVYERWPRND